MNDTAVKADTSSLLSAHGKPYYVLRKTETWEHGIGQSVYAANSMIVGCLMPVDGSTRIAEEGKRAISNYTMFTTYNADVQVGDRINLGCGNHAQVTHISNHLGRKVLRLRRVE